MRGAAAFLVRARDELNGLRNPKLTAPLVIILDEMARAIVNGDGDALEAAGGPAYWARKRRGAPESRAAVAKVYVALVEHALTKYGLHRLAEQAVARMFADVIGRWLDTAGVEYGLCSRASVQERDEAVYAVQRLADLGKPDPLRFAIALLVARGVDRAAAHTLLRTPRDRDLSEARDFWERI